MAELADASLVGTLARPEQDGRIGFAGSSPASRVKEKVMEWVRQCTLERKTDTGLEVQVSWIPEIFAKVGKFLKLKENDVWENGWKVALVGGRQTREDRTERYNDFKRQSKGSDMNRGSRHIEK
jgi:hypothetical protein